MACSKCGSDWATSCGNDSAGCPACSKQHRHQARKEGRFVEPEQEKACEECGSLFTAVGLQEIKARVLCRNPECKKSRKKRTRKESAKRRQEGTYINQPGRNARRACRRDGCSDLVKENRYQYCSKKCAGADAKELKRDFGGVPISTRKAIQIATWFHDWHCEHQKITPCLACGSLLFNTTGQRKFCDDSCRHRFANPLHELCIACGCQLNASTRCVRICKSCKKKRKAKSKRLSGKNARKRCKRHGVPYDSSVKPIEVFARDRYVCQLCGRKCLASYAVEDGMPLLLSPTIDHIVPISFGIKGHTWDNVQCACWECNVAKGAKPQGQLRLVAV